MADALALAVEATRTLRTSPAFRSLPYAERVSLERDLGRIEAALGRNPVPAPRAYGDRYAVALDEFPIPAGLLPPGAGAPPPATANPPAAAPPPTAAQGPVGAIGRQMANAVAAVDFPGFVASLVQGVFQAIVDATAQQVREYATLVSSLSRSLEDFTDENVTPNQARDALAQKHAADLQLILPAPGRDEAPRVAVRAGREGTRPAWLDGYDLSGEELSDELVEGPLLQKARLRHGEERLQTLATLVLMGINRIVVNDGDIRAKLQFHAQAAEKVSAEMHGGGMQQGIAGRAGASGAASMLVSTSSANVQAESSIRADLMGEVRVSFRTETFNLNNFANTQAIQLINRHARWQGEAPPGGAAPAGATPTPATSPAASTPVVPPARPPGAGSA